MSRCQGDRGGKAIGCAIRPPSQKNATPQMKGSCLETPRPHVECAGHASAAACRLLSRSFPPPADVPSANGPNSALARSISTSMASSGTDSLNVVTAECGRRHIERPRQRRRPLSALRPKRTPPGVRLADSRRTARSARATAVPQGYGASQTGSVGEDIDAQLLGASPLERPRG
jgi:hypothetical protein